MLEIIFGYGALIFWGLVALMFFVIFLTIRYRAKRRGDEDLGNPHYFASLNRDPYTDALARRAELEKQS